MTPQKAAIVKGLVNGGGHLFCWQTFVSLNAKNQLGGYTGKKIYRVMIRDGAVIYFKPSTDQIHVWMPKPDA
jgi:hypothetical protein